MNCRTTRKYKWVAIITLIAVGLQCFPITVLALEYKEKSEAQALVRQRAAVQNKDVRTTINKVNGLYNKYVTKNVDKLITPQTNSVVKFGLGALEGLSKGTLDFATSIYSLNKWTSWENMNVASANLLEKSQNNPDYLRELAKKAPVIGIAVGATLLNEGAQYLKKAKSDARTFGNMTGYLGTIFAGGLTGGAVKTSVKGLPRASQIAASASLSSKMAGSLLKSKNLILNLKGKAVAVSDSFFSAAFKAADMVSETADALMKSPKITAFPVAAGTTGRIFTLPKKATLDGISSVKPPVVSTAINGKNGKVTAELGGKMTGITGEKTIEKMSTVEPKLKIGTVGTAKIRYTVPYSWHKWRPVVIKKYLGKNEKGHDLYEVFELTTSKIQYRNNDVRKPILDPKAAGLLKETTNFDVRNLSVVEGRSIKVIGKLAKEDLKNIFQTLKEYKLKKLSTLEGIQK